MKKKYFLRKYFFEKSKKTNNSKTSQIPQIIFSILKPKKTTEKNACGSTPPEPNNVDFVSFLFFCVLQTLFHKPFVYGFLICSLFICFVCFAAWGLSLD